MEYTLIRSSRKTLALEITREGELLVRAPLRCAQREIDGFLQSHTDWIDGHIAKQKQRRAAHPEPDEETRRALIEKAGQLIPPLVSQYSGIMGLHPTGITITGAATRFGSCSGKNRLCFSWRLMQYPPAAIEYVVVHELAHIVHKNHGPDFYALVASVLPDYKERQRLLRM